MARKLQPTFVDSYIMHRLQEHGKTGWEENDQQLYSQCTAKCAWDTGSSHSVKKNNAHSKTVTVAHKTSLQHAPNHSSSTSHKTLLKKRFSLGSIPTTGNISTSSNTKNETRSNTAHFSSPSSTRKCYRKIRKGYTPAKASSSLSQGTSRRPSVSVSSHEVKRSTSSSHCGKFPPDFTLPRVGQRSNERESGDEIGSGWMTKSRKQNHFEKKMILQRRVDDLKITNTRFCRANDVRVHHKPLKRSSSISAEIVGVAKKWGHVGATKRWGDGESCFEDEEWEGEESGTSTVGDPINIEDESVFGDIEEEEGAGKDGDGGGFSVEDLTDLEDNDDDIETTSMYSSTEESSHITEQACTDDPITYMLLQKASQQLKQLLIASETEEPKTNNHCSHLQPRKLRCSTDCHSKPNKHQRVTRPIQSEPKPSTFDQKLHETDTTCFTRQPQMTTCISEPITIPSQPLTPSLFPGLQSTIHFPMPNEPYTPLPSALRSRLKWKMSTITPNVIKRCISRVGFTHCTKGTSWLGYWGKHMRSQAFRGIRDYQKVNHFPGSFEIGRKDRLWRNLSKLQSRVGKKHVNFVPLTFVLPNDLRLLKKEWESADSTIHRWILKPPAAARGIGVRVIHKWNQIPKKRPIIVQRYIANPFLINGNKFDLRVYVYVSSYDPLIIYVFKDGLARFATCKYSSAMRSLSNRFMHVTNYSVNKQNSEFSQNPDETQCQGHKWGLLALWQYMNSELGLNTDVIWESIKDLIIKTIISSESHCSSLVKTYVQNSYSCHELFGFDVMLDRKLKPWIIEVNISPSLHSNSQLDINIKGQMVRDLLNIAGFKLPSTNNSTTEKSFRHSGLTADERQKHSHYLQRTLPELERKKILDKLTPDDITVLMHAEDEFSRRGMFERVFPSEKSGKYRKYFESEKYYNILLEQWLVKYQHFPTRGIEFLKRLKSLQN